MEERQPGQTYSPTTGETGAAAPGPVSGQQTTDEISQIDSAMSAQAPVGSSEPSATPEASTAVQQPADAPAVPQQTEGQEVEPASSLEGATPPGSPVAAVDEEPLLYWKAAEPASSLSSGLKPVLSMGVVAIAVAVVLIILGGVNFGTILGILAVVLGVVALFISNQQHGHMEEYEIHPNGVTIGGRHYDFTELESFGTISDGGAYVVELVPTQRFMPRLSLHLEPTTADQVVELLSQHLPMENRKPDMVDKIYKKLGM